MNPRPCRLALLASILGPLLLALSGHGFAQPKPLEILLTYDDGFDSSGLKVMHAALVAAGHQVTVVAPGRRLRWGASRLRVMLG